MSNYLLGIDEVGRGPWAGPLVVGAVVLGKQFANFTDINGALTQTTHFATEIEPLLGAKSLKQAKQLRDQLSKTHLFSSEQQIDLYQTWLQLTDSKKLTLKKRENLNDFILQNADATGLGWVSATEIDQYGLSAALKLAARRATEQIKSQRSDFTKIIIDGTINLLDETPLADKVTLLPKADYLVKEVSAASIIAKVARDHYMADLATKYPAYGFEKHVGYGTAAHKNALLEHGVCPEYRLSFRPVREIAQRQNHHQNAIPPNKQELSQLSNNHTRKGNAAENLVADYLRSQNHTIIAQNFKTKICEIDIISIKDSQIFFTEVKYRLDNQHGTALDQITSQKLQQMHRSAEIFLMLNPKYQNHQPLLAAASVSGTRPKVEDWFVIPS